MSKKEEEIILRIMQFLAIGTGFIAIMISLFGILLNLIN